MLPIEQHAARWPFAPGKQSAKTANFIAGKSIFVTDVDDYDLYRSALYALGAQSVANKMLAHVNLVLHGRSEIPAKVRTKYPKGEYFPAEKIIPLFHQEIPSFGDFIQALGRHGFTIRNPSDEADATIDSFAVPLVENSLHQSLLHYLQNSDFVRHYAKKQYFPIDKREDAYVDFPIPGTDVTWYYTWNIGAWHRVRASRGDGDYPLEIKGEQLLRVAPVFWTQSTGLYFYEYPHTDSISGLFIQAGIERRSGRADRVEGIAISRVWT